MLPTGLSYVSGTGSGWSCGASGQVVTCSNLGPLAPGASSAITLTVGVGQAAHPSVTNTASVATPGETNTANNGASDPTTVDPAPPMMLTVSKSGNGSGTVTSSPAGIDCGSTCSASYASGTQVTLSASPAAGSTFPGWQGACSGTASCQVTLDDAQSVTAVFQATPVGVQVHRMPGTTTLRATLTARSGCGGISQIQFGTAGQPFANAQVTIVSPAGGPSGQTISFGYTPPPGATSVSLDIRRVVESGAATVSPIRLFDGCGEWRTFVGGGPDAFR